MAVERTTTMEPLSLDAFCNDMDSPMVLSSIGGGWQSGLLRRWMGGSGEIAQPVLDHHYIALHLGGPKTVTRLGAGSRVSKRVEDGSITIVPAGTRYEWNTVGPIDYVHLYIRPGQLLERLKDVPGDPGRITLDEVVGEEDPLLAETLRAMMLQVAKGPRAIVPFLDALVDVAVDRLASRYAGRAPASAQKRYRIAPWKLKRILQYVEANIHRGITVEELAQYACMSRFHFSRSFRAAVGQTPSAFIQHNRVQRAKALLDRTGLALSEIATRCGFASQSHFSSLFKTAEGITPSAYRTLRQS